MEKKIKEETFIKKYGSLIVLLICIVISGVLYFNKIINHQTSTVIDALAGLGWINYEARKAKLENRTIVAKIFFIGVCIEAIMLIIDLL